MDSPSIVGLKGAAEGAFEGERARLRALWVTSMYPSRANEARGTFLRTQVQALSRSDVDVSVVAPTPMSNALLARVSRKWREYNEMPRDLWDGQVRVSFPRYLAIPNESYSGAPHLKFRNTILRTGLARRSNVIHGQFVYPEGLSAVEVGRRIRVPVVITLRGSDVNVFPEHDARSLARFRAAIGGAERVLCVSAALADRTEQLTGLRPEILFNGVKLSSFVSAPAREHARNQLNLPPHRFIVLFVGNLLQTKGVGELLEAMKSDGLRDALAVYVGTGPMLERVQESGTAVAVGAVSHDMVPTYMAAADVLALPSYSEGTPNVVVEAGAIGLPVVGTCVGGMTELLGEGRGVLIAPRSVPDLAWHLVQVRDNYQDAQERADKLRAYVMRFHDADTNAKVLKEIYLETALAGAKRGDQTL